MPHIYFKEKVELQAHKINNAIGQAILPMADEAYRQTGAGQHGVATATGVREVWIGASFIWAQRIWKTKLNVFRMRLLGRQ